MAKHTDATKYETSNFKPTWINQSFPTDEEYEAVKDIVKFYLIQSPCTRTSSRGIDISAWDKSNTVLWDKMKHEIQLVKGKNFDYGKSKSAMKTLFDRYNLTTDFTNVRENMIVFLNTDNVFESIFKHIRNAIAHSRWQVVNDWYYFEDGSDESFDGEIYFCVTARIVLNKDSLIKWRDLINAGPDDGDKAIIDLDQTLEELLNKLRNMFAGSSFTRKEAIQALKIDNNMWTRLYKRGKKDEVMKFEKKQWTIR